MKKTILEIEKINSFIRSSSDFFLNLLVTSEVVQAWTDSEGVWLSDDTYFSYDEITLTPVGLDLGFANLTLV